MTEKLSDRQDRDLDYLAKMVDEIRNIAPARGDLTIIDWHYVKLYDVLTIIYRFADPPNCPGLAIVRDHTIVGNIRLDSPKKPQERPPEAETDEHDPYDD